MQDRENNGYNENGGTMGSVGGTGDGSGYFKHYKEDDIDSGTMDAIDPEEYKKFLNSRDDNFEEEMTPIEVKSTLHLQLQQREEEKKEIKESAHTAVNEVFDWMESILTAVVIIVLIFTFVIRINTVTGTSMAPTLEEGQKLLVTDLFYTPSYNDVVIVQAANLDGGKPIVKRVIGLPGDTVMIDFTEGIVYRNGEPLNVERIDGFLYEDGHKINTYTTLRQDMVSNHEYTVPEDSYFVLGDNRDNSKDSRLLTVIGFIDKKYIAGRAVFSIFPFDTFGAIE